MMNLEEIKADLEINLKPHRYQHTLRVAEISKKYAKHYGLDEAKAYLAGLLHDCSKGREEFYIEKYKEQWLEFLKNHKDEDIENINLLHGYTGYIVAKEKYKVYDIEILNAIMYHSTGRKDMSDLEKIVLLADKIEPGRKYPGVDDIRLKAKENLNLGLFLSTNRSLEYLLKKNEYISLNTIKLRNQLINLRGQYID